MVVYSHFERGSPLQNQLNNRLKGNKQLESKLQKDGDSVPSYVVNNVCQSRCHSLLEKRKKNG